VPVGMSRVADSHAASVEMIGAADYAESDLLDFLAGDLDPVPADPAFREELREQCWSLVQEGATRPKDH